MGRMNISYVETTDALTDVRAADTSMMALAVDLEALAALGVGNDDRGLQGVREERVWVGSDAELPGGGVAVQGPLDGGHQQGVEVFQVVRAAHASAVRQAETLSCKTFTVTVSKRKKNENKQ